MVSSCDWSPEGGLAAIIRFEINKYGSAGKS